jgi:hypothetical protein
MTCAAFWRRDVAYTHFVPLDHASSQRLFLAFTNWNSVGWVGANAHLPTWYAAVRVSCDEYCTCYAVLTLLYHGDVAITCQKFTLKAGTVCLRGQFSSHTLLASCRIAVQTEPNQQVALFSPTDLLPVLKASVFQWIVQLIHSVHFAHIITFSRAGKWLKTGSK